MDPTRNRISRGANGISASNATRCRHPIFGFLELHGLPTRCSYRLHCRHVWDPTSPEVDLTSLKKQLAGEWLGRQGPVTTKEIALLDVLGTSTILSRCGEVVDRSALSRNQESGLAMQKRLQALRTASTKARHTEEKNPSP